MATVTVPVNLGGSGITYSDSTDAKGMAGPDGYGYKTNLFPMLADFVALGSNQTAAAQTAVAAAGSSLWNAATNYAQYAVVWSPTDLQSYRRKVAGISATDPVNDATNWTRLTLNTIGGRLLLAGAVDDGVNALQVNGGGKMTTSTLATTATVLLDLVSSATDNLIHSQAIHFGYTDATYGTRIVGFNNPVATKTGTLEIQGAVGTGVGDAAYATIAKFSNSGLAVTGLLTTGANSSVNPSSGYIIFGNSASATYIDAAAGGPVVIRPNGSTQIAAFSSAGLTINGAGSLSVGGAAGINGKAAVANVAAPAAAGATFTAAEQTLLNDIRTRLINFGIYT